MKGHEFLTSIGILHRDVSENNIVLGLYPWEERGYLIDFDMAILQDAEEPTPVSSTQSDCQPLQATGESSTKTPPPGQTTHVKGLRTVGVFMTLVSYICQHHRKGTFPYISANVLMGHRHTHFDDIESFLWVLLFFFPPMQAPFPRRYFTMPTKMDLFEQSGLDPCPI